MRSLLLKYSQHSNKIIHCNLTHTTFNHSNDIYTVFFDGEIYNFNECNKQLIEHKFASAKECIQLLCNAYFHWGNDFIKHIEGPFVFIIQQNEQLKIFHDIFSLYPLFYTTENDIFYLSNHLTSILDYKKYHILTKEGLIDLFAFGPSIREGNTLYKGIYTIPLYSMLSVHKHQIKTKKIYSLCAKKHEDSLAITKSKIRSLVINSIKNQANNVNASFLSGGLDSSIISAICYQNNLNWTTYSFNYQQNDKYFRKNQFQVASDEAYINDFLKMYPCNHKKFEISQNELVALIKDAMIMRSLPGMADIDSALLWLCKQVSSEQTIILSGECSDEIFGGYPWFYKQNTKQNNFFPWLRSSTERISILNKNIQNINYLESIEKEYHKILSNLHMLDDDNNEDQNARIHTITTLHYFTQVLITRQVFAADYSNLCIRVPFANIKLLEYVYNIPWSMKHLNNCEKGILREAFKNELPQSIYTRKKNPFPKTHHPLYTNLITNLLQQRFNDPSSPLHILFDNNQLKKLILTKGTSFSTPFFGQLMSGPQLLAYIYQIDQWIETYHIHIEY